MLLLTVIYLTFISLGLPDTILGAAWPSVRQSLGAPLPYAGAISVLISSGTVISCLLANRILQRFGTAPVVAASVLLTALALFGFAQANVLLSMVLLAAPLGLGAGAIDVALNHFVARHYPARHMNYLHSFWGVGATAGPFIMAHYLAATGGWRSGYLTLAALQFVLVLILLLSLPLWRQVAKRQAACEPEEHGTYLSNTQALRQRGVWLQLWLFACYCSLEASTGLWLASYLISEKGRLAADAAFWTAIFYLGITLGRALGGLWVERLREAAQIRLGAITLLIGTLGLSIHVNECLSSLSIVLMGLGCAPIFPNTLHLSPRRFGTRASQAVVGLSMATAYTGTTLMPALLGGLMAAASFSIFPLLLMLFSLSILWASEYLQVLTKSNEGA